MTTSSYPTAHRTLKYSGFICNCFRFIRFRFQFNLMVILTTMACSFPVIANQQHTIEQAESSPPIMYLFYDEHGKPVYSDSQPINQHFVAIEIKEVDTLNWVQTKSTPTQKTTRRSKSSSVEDKSKQVCIQLSKKIEKLNNQLRAGLSAKQFDQVKSELIDKRWQYKKNC